MAGRRQAPSLTAGSPPGGWTAAQGVRLRRPSVRGIAAASALLAVVGLGLLALPWARQLAGEWRQFDLVTASDRRTRPYLGALRSAYELPMHGSTVGAVAKWPPPAQSIEGVTIAIPSIGVDQAVVADVSVEALRNGPGHYPGTALPGGLGTMVISGHRTTFTRPFRDLDRLSRSDTIVLASPERVYRYRVQRIAVVAPTDLRPVQEPSGRRLVLTTCHPPGSATRRLLVIARLLPTYGVAI
jgi:LPXTG-site transpeptidase (sortase) family protein